MGTKIRIQYSVSKNESLDSKLTELVTFGS